MSEFLKVLLNIRSLRAAMRELSLEQVKEAHEKIESIYLERLEQAEKEQAATKAVGHHYLYGYTTGEFSRTGNGHPSRRSEYH